MKIAIIGAGIAGCTAYLELQKHLPEATGDHEIIIYEAYKDIDPSSEQRDGDEEEHSDPSTLLVGGGLGIAPNGLNVLRRLDPDLLKSVVRGGYVVSTSNLKNKHGSLLMSLKSHVSSASEENIDTQKMHMVASSRHAFWKALRARIPDAQIINKRVREVVPDAEKRNIVHFVDDSAPVEADLVIGADGVRSTTKRAIFADAEEDSYLPHYEGLVGVGGFIPTTEVRDLVEKGSMNFIFGGNGFFGYFFADSAVAAANRDSPYHISEPGELLAWWSTYAIEECPNGKTLDMADVTRQLRERHAYWKDPVVQKVIQSIRVQNMYPTWTSPPLRTWERDGVVLVGDAAHALPSSSGQGSSQALEDVEALALFLAHYLRAECQDKEHQRKDDEENEDCVAKAQKRAIMTAAKQYINLRQPRVTEILENAQKMQSTKRDMGLLQEYSMYAVMKIIGWFPSLMTDQIRRVNEYNVADHVAQVLSELGSN
ncbi:hypothetical protein NUU61_002792 [Penicillium alfredii]|uniref:FAD-binding domain-containing protein n=1 Tax=Penicillium alfredii TaxID=1506179 RepID=A0A9W9FS87_9EURO|nr:uncharacterized protein NUU61_002792 [Penicillium alfredii]KAJ5105445.1 hypothetical protein NUU61_002792 [Penicillium alfredii]